MNRTPFTRPILAGLALSAATAAMADSPPTVPGASGRTFVSAAVQCVVPPGSEVAAPMVQVGLVAPTRRTRAGVTLDGTAVATLTAAAPVAEVWLAEGAHTVAVALSRRVQDRFDVDVIPGLCTLPVGNWLSADGTLEYGASGKSYATVTPGCALNPATGRAQPYVNLFDNGTFLLNVSVNGVPLTQLSVRKPHVPVFLAAGTNLVAVAEASLSTDHFVRSGGDGTCTLP